MLTIFFSQYFKYVMQLPHGSMVCEWKSHVNLIMDLLYNLLLSSCFQHSYFIFGFVYIWFIYILLYIWQLDFNVFLYRSLLVNPSWIHWDSWMCRFMSSTDWDEEAIIFLNILSVLSLLSLQGSYYMYISMLDGVHRSLRLCSFLFVLFSFIS